MNTKIKILKSKKKIYTQSSLSSLKRLSKEVKTVDNLYAQSAPSSWYLCDARMRFVIASGSRMLVRV